MNFERPENNENEKLFIDQAKDFLAIVAENKKFRETINNFRNKRITGETEEDFIKRNSLSDLEIISRMAGNGGLYDLVHESGLTYQDIQTNIKATNKIEFIQNFDDELSSKLEKIVSDCSKVRCVGPAELMMNNQANFVWFKGNSKLVEGSREVRFYINAGPEGVDKVAEYLAKVSDYLDKYNLRFQFKFRKDLAEYERTDTCVAYLYIPGGNDEKNKDASDQWLKTVGDVISKIPPEALRSQNSFFTNKIADGVSWVDDSREQGSKKGESYTSQITKSIAEAAGEVASEYSVLDPEAAEKIAFIALEKLKKLNYFKSA